MLLIIQATLTVGVLLTMARWAVNNCSDVMLLYVILILREDYLIFVLYWLCIESELLLYMQ